MQLTIHHNKNGTWAEDNGNCYRLAVWGLDYKPGEYRPRSREDLVVGPLLRNGAPAAWDSTDWGGVSWDCIGEEDARYCEAIYEVLRAAEDSRLFRKLAALQAVERFDSEGILPESEVRSRAARW